MLIILNLDNRVPQNHKSNSFGVTTAWHVRYRVLINLEIGKILSHCNIAELNRNMKEEDTSKVA